MPTSAKVVPAFVFGVIACLLGNLMMLVYRLAGIDLLGALGSGVNAGPPIVLSIGAIIVIPLLLFLSAGIDHLMLMLFRAKGPFESTFRVYAYTSGSSSLLAVVPYFGFVVSWLWGFIAKIAGYSQVHEISLPSAAIACLLPIVLCCFCFFGSLGVLGLLGYALKIQGM